MDRKLLLLLVLGLAGSCFAKDSSDAGTAVNLYQQLSPSCEIAQPASLVQHGEYAFVVIAGTGDEVFSPELSKDDRVVAPLDLPQSILKLARKSGFRVEQKNAPTPSPQVLRKDGSAQCPTVEEALRIAAQQRELHRQEKQSKEYRQGHDDVVPPRIVGSLPEESSTKPKASGAKLLYQGPINISVLIGIDGKVSEAKVVNSVPAETGKEASELAKKWRFTPATIHGLPVPVRLNIVINFKNH